MLGHVNSHSHVQTKLNNDCDFKKGKYVLSCDHFSYICRGFYSVAPYPLSNNIWICLSIFFTPLFYIKWWDLMLAFIGANINLLFPVLDKKYWNQHFLRKVWPRIAAGRESCFFLMIVMNLVWQRPFFFLYVLEKNLHSSNWEGAFNNDLMRLKSNRTSRPYIL